VNVTVDTATYLEPIVLRDADGLAVTDKVNADFTVTAILDGVVVSVASTITHTTNGIYSLLATFTDIGTGTVFVSVEVDGETIEDVQTVEVEVAEVDDTATTPTPLSASGVTLKTLRRKVAKRIPGEQFIVLVATDGDTTEFRDTENLQGPTNAYVGSDLYLLDGLNAGKQRRIQSYSQSLGQLTWRTALPTAVVEGDEAELWNVRGIGVTATQVNDAINDAIESLAKNVWIPVAASVTDDFDQDSPTIAIPASLTRGFYALNWQDSVSDGIWYDVDGGGEVPRSGWWYDAANGVIQVDGDWRSRIHGRAVRILGYGGTGVLSADTDMTPIDSEAIVTEAASNLLVANGSRNPDFERYLQRADALAAARRPFAVGRKAPNTIVF
jgi:hypothetical protein